MKDQLRPGAAMRRLIMALMACAISFASGRAEAAQIVGRVLDAQGQPISGITVRLENARGDRIASTVSAPDGAYGLFGLSEGTYTLDVQGQSAVTYVGREGVTVNWGLKNGAALAVAEPGSASAAAGNAHAEAFTDSDPHTLAPLNLVSADRRGGDDHGDCDRDDHDEHRSSRGRCKCDDDRDDPRSCKQTPHR
jgi:hypothetical protein